VAGESVVSGDPVWQPGNTHSPALVKSCQESETGCKLHEYTSFDSNLESWACFQANEKHGATLKKHTMAT